ncbi:ATP-binding protein, partial [Enterobacter hormaechei]
AEPLAPLSYLGLREEPPEIVGREYELEQLAAALEAVQRGQSRRVVIHGPMGVGKTHLVQHFLRSLPEGVRGLIAPRMGSSTALRQAIRQGLEPFVKGSLAQWVQGMDQGRPSEAALAYTLGLIDQPDLEPGDLERYLIEGWRAALEMLSRQSPLVLVLEDLHSTEPAILEFTRQAPEGRVLMVMTARRNRWSRGPDLQVLELAPLSLQESQRLVQI